MLKNIENISGTKLIEKSKQKTIAGGNYPPFCTRDSDCPGGRCVGGWMCAN
ncbi:MAG: hypothetical protein AB8B65_05950 [Kordia sp.]|uniref:hypothetical protein n=1 Tax=Kordia sp. TaxID=1965332 RepID=UPI00385A8046